MRENLLLCSLPEISETQVSPINSAPTKTDFKSDFQLALHEGKSYI